MHLFETRLHTEPATQSLYAFDGQRIAVGQRHSPLGHPVGNGGDTLAVLRVARVILHGLRFHTREGVRVHVIRVGGHMRDAAIGEACGKPLREQGQVTQGQEAAVALPERDPRAAAERAQAQMLEVPDNRISKETLEICRLCLRVPDTGHDVRIDTRGTPGAALVRQHDTEMLQRFGKPRVPAAVGHRARARTARPALQEQQQRQVLMLATRFAHHPVEQPDRLARH